MKTISLIIISLLSMKGFSQDATLLFKNKELSIYSNSAYYNGIKLYNSKDDLNKLIAKEKTTECSVDYRFYYNPLSLIDTYYSYESGEGGITACGVPGNYLKIQTINLTHNKAISLTSIFSEESILKALKNDKWVKENMKNIDISSINSFETFLEKMNTLGYVKFNSNSFAILGYKNEKVVVRFVGIEYMGYNHNKHLQLGLLLTPKKEYRKLFKKNLYFTISDYNNGLIKHVIN